jgi:hypothetical protein
VRYAEPSGDSSNTVAPLVERSSMDAALRTELERYREERDALDLNGNKGCERMVSIA